MLFRSVGVGGSKNTRLALTDELTNPQLVTAATESDPPAKVPSNLILMEELSALASKIVVPAGFIQR